MKKYLFMFLAAVTVLCVACGRDDEPWEEAPPQNPQEVIRDMITNETFKNLTIVRLYDIKMRRALVYPFKVYVMQMNTGNWYFLLRYRYNQDLRVGDKISFSTYSYSPNEICSINGIDLGDGDDGSSNDDPGGGEYWVVSDPIEATVQELFSMKVIYGIPLLAFDSQFILTTDGNLLYVKKLKLNISLQPGDRIVYDVYTWAPNEIVAIKKLR